MQEVRKESRLSYEKYRHDRRISNAVAISIARRTTDEFSRGRTSAIHAGDVDRRVTGVARPSIYLMLCTESRCLRKLASIRDLYGQYWQEKCVSKVTMPQPIFRCLRRFDAHEYIWPQRGQTCSRGLTIGKRGASEKRGLLKCAIT